MKNQNNIKIQIKNKTKNKIDFSPSNKIIINENCPYSNNNLINKKSDLNKKSLPNLNLFPKINQENYQSLKKEKYAKNPLTKVHSFIHEPSSNEEKRNISYTIDGIKFEVSNTNMDPNSRFIYLQKELTNSFSLQNYDFNGTLNRVNSINIRNSINNNLTSKEINNLTINNESIYPKRKFHDYNKSLKDNATKKVESFDLFLRNTFNNKNQSNHVLNCNRNLKKQYLTKFFYRLPALEEKKTDSLIK